MGFFDFFKRSKRTVPIRDVSIRSPKTAKLFVSDGQVTYYDADYTTYINKAFRGNVDVYKITTDIAGRCAENPLELVKVRDKKALSNFYAKGVQPYTDIFKMRQLKAKAMESAVENSKILTLLQKPNLYQTGDELEEMMSVWWQIAGRVVLWAQRLDDTVPDSEVVALHCLPPYDVAAVSDGQMRGVKGYKITSINKEISKEDILIVSRIAIRVGEDYGPTPSMSPFEPGKMTLERANETEQTAVDMLKTKGAMGAVYVDDPYTTAEDEDGAEGESGLEKHESQFVKKMYGRFSRGRIFFSNAKLGYVNFGRTSDEIGITEHEKLSTSKICRLLNYPEILLTGDIKYENLRSASKQLILSNIIPYQTKIAQALTNWLLPKFGKEASNLALVYDPFYYSEVQQDIQAMGPVLENISFLTINQKLEYLGYEKSTEPFADKILVKQGLVPLEDLELPTELPNQDYSQDSSIIQ